MLNHHQLPPTSSRNNKKKKKPSPPRSSSISIEAPKGCLRFFSKSSPNRKKPTSKLGPNVKISSRSSNISNENVAKVKKPNKILRNVSKKMPSTCSKDVHKEKRRLDESDSALQNPDKNVKEDATEKPDSNTASGQFSKQTIGNENVVKVKKHCKISRNGLKRMPSTCSKEVHKEKPRSEEPNSGIDTVNRSVLQEIDKNVKEEKANMKTASGQFSKESIGNELGTIDFVVKCTPVVSKLDKIVRNDKTSSNTTTSTPPVQASVSPEINCASSSSVLAVSAAKTPACYGAGHIVSGVTDRRKCRARGVLTVGQKDSSFTNLEVVENGDDLADVKKSPVEASVHWLLSPCEEDLMTSSYLSNVSESTNGRYGRPSNSSLHSPKIRTLFGKSGDFSSSTSPNCETNNPKEPSKNRLTLESSPFSGGSLGSGNVIQTPQSESSSDRHVDMSWLETSEEKTFSFRYEIESAREDFSGVSLSPKINRSNGCSSFISNSMSGEMSPSLLRVSWRDGLPRRIFEMDECDVCRCLSDDEKDADKSSSGKIKSRLSHEKEIISLESVAHAVESNHEREEEFRVKRSNPCEESICIDVDGVAVSGDSDWTSWYKSPLFDS